LSRGNHALRKSFEIPELNQALLKWEQVYDTIRPHQALGYLTPQQFLTRHQQNQKKEVRRHQSYERVQGIDKAEWLL